MLERLFVEERRRLKIIPNAFGERAVLKLMFGALIRAAERWCSIKVTDFEHRQITAVRKELDQEYEAQVGLKTQFSKDAAPIKNHQLSWWFDGEPLKAVSKDSATFGMGLWDH